MHDQLHSELAAVIRRLLDAIDSRDWPAYRALTAEDLTSFEPEAKGQRIDGLPFHGFFVSRPHRAGATVRSEIVNLHVRPLTAREGSASAPSATDAHACDAAVVCYTRITQKHDPDGTFRLSHANETRALVRTDRGWRQVHFHRSEW